jgi:hypothetical protein
MADDVETKETESEVEDSELKPEDLEELPQKRPYLMLHSGVRKRHTRQLRMRNAMANRAKFVQRIGGGDIIVRRNRPAAIFEEQFIKFRKEIEEKVALGLLELRTPSGQLVDITTMRAEPVPVTPPLPNPVREEVMPGRRHIPPMPGGKGLGEEAKTPEILKDKLPDSPSSETKKPTLLTKDAVPPPPPETTEDPAVPPVPESEAVSEDLPPVKTPEPLPEPQENPPVIEEPPPAPPTEPAPPAPPQHTEPMAQKHEERGSSKKDRKDKRR